MHGIYTAIAVIIAISSTAFYYEATKPLPEIKSYIEICEGYSAYKLVSVTILPDKTIKCNYSADLSKSTLETYKTPTQKR